MPLIIDRIPEKFAPPEARRRDRGNGGEDRSHRRHGFEKWPLFEKDAERVLPHIAFYFASGAGMIPGEILKKTRLAEIADDRDVKGRIRELKQIHPGIIVAIRVELTADGHGAGHRARRTGTWRSSISSPT